MGIGIDVEGIIWTTLHASLTSDASLGIEIDDSVFPLPERRHWTDIGTGRVITVVAPHYREVPTRIREFPLFDILHPCLINPDWIVMFGLTSDRARVAANTPTVINYEAEISNSYTSLY